MIKEVKLKVLCAMLDNPQGRHLLLVSHSGSYIMPVQGRKKRMLIHLLTLPAKLCRLHVQHIEHFPKHDNFLKIKLTLSFLRAYSEIANFEFSQTKYLPK